MVERLLAWIRRREANFHPSDPEAWVAAHEGWGATLRLIMERLRGRG